MTPKQQKRKERQYAEARLTGELWRLPKGARLYEALTAFLKGGTKEQAQEVVYASASALSQGAAITPNELENIFARVEKEALTK